MRAILTTLGEVLAIAAISVGFWGYDWRLGVITAGVGIFALSVAAA